MVQTIKAISEAQECECQTVELKSVLRVLEKVDNISCYRLFLTSDPTPFASFTLSLSPLQVFLDYAGDFSLVTDLLRGKIFVPNLVTMAAVIRALATHPDILIIKIKNRVGESSR